MKNFLYFANILFFFAATSISGLATASPEPEPKAGRALTLPTKDVVANVTRSDAQRKLLADGQSRTLPSSTTSDWSGRLDDVWTCGKQVGPRWDQWKKSLLLFAATGGYSFKAACNYMLEIDPDQRLNTALIIFRDRNNVPQYVAWYDWQLDYTNEPVFGGITPLTAEIQYDIRYPDYKNYPLHSATPQQLEAYYAYRVKISDVMDPDYNFWAYRDFSDLLGSSIDRLPGCNPPYWRCGTGPLTFGLRRGEARLDINVFPEEVYKDNSKLVVGSIYAFDYPEIEWYEKLMMATIAAGWTVLGGGIGEYIGLVSGTAQHAAFAAGFGGFNSSLIQGSNVGDALLNGLKGAGLAYTGKLVLNAYGEPDSLVGVSGKGCPTGDGCWYFQMANGLPPLKHLAELHDPFINWSTKALQNIGDIGNSGWYKAVTIAPFIVPGCLASAPCVTGGIVIVSDDEVD